MRYGLIVLLSCSLAGCGVASLTGSSDDQKQWQGTWTMVACTYDGGPQTADMQWIVDGDHYNIRLSQQLGPDPYTITLDPSRKRVDVFHHDTPPGTFGGKLKGLYEISGDSLTVVYDLTGTHYPNSFDAPLGSRQVLYKFRRERP